MSCHPTDVEIKPARTEDQFVCLVGMPNAGKTTLMNALTGGNFKTANYPGVTVSLLRGRTKPEFGAPRNLIDLPGVHSVVAPSPEEELACQVIEGKHAKVKPDAFVLVVDATQLERHLKFAGLVARQSKPMVVALTMMDLLPRTRQIVDPKGLSETLGVPVIPVDPRTGKGMEDLIGALDLAVANPSKDTNALAQLPSEPVSAFMQVRDLLRKSGAVSHSNEADSVTSKIDGVVLHKYLGFPIFVIVLASLFAAIFKAAQPFMDTIDKGFGLAANLVTSIAPNSFIVKFLAEGIIQGVGVVAVFFPQILILFFLMTLLEDSGYLARAATLVDRPLSFVGLHGRSFVPMLSGFACAIPAVFAARSIPSRRERLLTIWILPLMSCSARLPVYALLLAALLPSKSWQQGISLAVIYISSLLSGALVAGLASRIFLKYRTPSLLAMELPAYRKPRLKPILKMTWARGFSYLQRAGLPIMMVSAVLWLISNLGATPDRIVAMTPKDQSFAAQIGHKMEPVWEKMGVDWRAGVGLISAFAAREVFVSSMAIVYGVDDTNEDTQQQGLLAKMRGATFPGTGQRIFTASSVIGLVVFFFFSLQCFSTVAVVRKEMNSWKLAGLQLLFYTGLGYTLSVLTVQALRAFGVA